MRDIRRYTAYELVFLLCLMVLAGCGKASYEAKENTVFVLDKGRIVSTDVGELPQEQYSAEEFEDYVNRTIKTYTDENGSGTVSLESLSTEGDTVTLTISYASAKDYARFTGTDLFTGTISEVLDEGYRIQGTFVNAGSGGLCDYTEVLDNGSLKAAVYRGEGIVQVDGDIVYYSDGNVKLTGDRTVSIQAGDVQGDSESLEEGTEPTEQFLSINYEGDTDGTNTEELSGGSIDDDEMLTGTEEAQKTFRFDREQGSSGQEDAGVKETGSYTYIFYK